MSHIYYDLQVQIAELKAQLAQYPAVWLEDSSLETWFPLTAEELKRTKSELDDMTKARNNLLRMCDHLREIWREEEGLGDAFTRDLVASWEKIEAITSLVNKACLAP